ncbi:MAG: 4Fe-4S ferredoxin [Bacillota bacterium]|nr:4Fe-4S ferredoxin [Bacillota bacterium]
MARAFNKSRRLVSAGRDRLRLWVQIVFTAATNGYFKGFSEGRIYTGTSKSLCLPGLNCYSCPGALGSCPIGSLQAVLASRNFSISFYLTGFFLLVGTLLGRIVCGWLCPFGLIQDLIYRIPFLRKIKKVPGDRVLRFVKYGILLVFVILLPMFVVDIVGQGEPWFCKWICPSGTLMAGWPLVFRNEGIQQAVGLLFLWKNAILFLFIFLSVIIYRPFCKYICPLGAIYGLFNRVSFIRLRIDRSRCVHCHACTRACKMNVQVEENPDSMECIRCGSCVSACGQKALAIRADRRDSQLR